MITFKKYCLSLAFMAAFAFAGGWFAKPSMQTLSLPNIKSLQLSMVDGYLMIHDSRIAHTNIVSNSFVDCAISGNAMQVDSPMKDNCVIMKDDPKEQK